MPGGGFVWSGRFLLREEGAQRENGQEEWPERAEDVHVGLDEVGRAGFQCVARYGSDAITDRLIEDEG